MTPALCLGANLKNANYNILKAMKTRLVGILTLRAHISAYAIHFLVLKCKKTEKRFIIYYYNYHYYYYHRAYY